MNIVEQIAHHKKRSWITPEDIELALVIHDEDEVRLAVLETLSGNHNFSWEDGELCCWVAFQGKR